jgi:hypothetical protein
MSYHIPILLLLQPPFFVAVSAHPPNVLSVSRGIHQPQLALAILVEGELATEQL